MEDYVKEAESQLNNKENYRKINYYLTTVNNETIHKVISKFQKENLLSKNISEELKSENPKTPHFYLKSKVHKEGNPGRHVISSINSHTSKVSEYVDYHLPPIVKEISSYVQDTTDFLRKINWSNFVPDNSYVVSLDVKSSYTNISNADGIKSGKTSLEKYSKRTASSKVITTFLLLILTLNNFMFSCRSYLQMKGCAMGTICAPSYANIFMDHFERKFIYPFIKTFSLIYFRFIDAIFFIWTGSKTDLDKFLNELNAKHPSIKFEYETSKKRISFLDTEIYIKNNKLHTKIFRKKTDCQTFLNINSEHPKSLKNSIPYSQALQVKRNCSTKKDFDHHSRELKERFLKQGYDQGLLDEQLEKVDKLVRTFADLREPYMHGILKIDLYSAKRLLPKIFLSEVEWKTISFRYAYPSIFLD